MKVHFRTWKALAALACIAGGMSPWAAAQDEAYSERSTITASLSDDAPLPRATASLSDDAPMPAATGRLSDESDAGIAEYPTAQNPAARYSAAQYPAARGPGYVRQAGFYLGGGFYQGGYSGGGNCVPDCGYGDCYGDSYCDDLCLPILTVRAEYLAWWTRGRPIPPLVTTSPDGTDRDDAGVLGIDGTEVLFGDENIGERMRSGGRVSLSYLCDEYSETYFDVRFWGLENGNESFFAESDGSPILARPFFNPLLGEDAQLIAFPDVVTDGRISINSDNDLYGGDAMLRCLWSAGDCGEVYLLGGYQFTALDDTLFIRNVTTSIDPDSALIPGTVIDVQDAFSAQNRFHAGSAGVSLVRYGCKCDWELLGKVAMGQVRQRVVIDGRSIQTPPDGEDEVNEGGLLAQPSNIGEYERNRFAVIPELNLNVRFHIHHGCDMVFGYSIIYWNDVVLAGDQIDRGDTLGPPVGDGFPRFAFNSNDFWAQGMNLGLECRW
jgi:hypothetical protein